MPRPIEGEVAELPPASCNGECVVSYKCSTKTLGRREVVLPSEH